MIINWTTLNRLLGLAHEEFPNIKAGDTITVHLHKMVPVKIEIERDLRMYVHEYLGISGEECDDRVIAWLEGDQDIQLHEYLGIPWEDFKNLKDAVFN